MTDTRRAVVLVVVLAVGLAIANAGTAMASEQRPYRLSDQQLKDLVNRIDTHRDAFQASFDRAIDRSPIANSLESDQIDTSMKYFKQATDLLHDRVNDRQSGMADAENVLRRASVIDGFMMSNPLETAVQSGWRVLRADLNDLAHAYAVTWDWSAASENGPYRVDDRQVEQLLKQIGEKAGRFDQGLDRAFASVRTDDRRGKDELRQSVKDLKQTTDRLRDRVDGRQSTTFDVEEVLRRGVGIDGLMQRYRLSAQAERDWLSLRGDLDGLARAYHVDWDWGHLGYPPAEPGTGFHQGLTGTYQLENDRGDEPRRAAEQAASAVPANQRQRTYESLLTRLEAPELIAIERRESSVTMASTRGQRVTIEADGRNHREQWSAQQTMNTRATLQGERFVVTTTGNRGSDYTVTFEPMANGRGLNVTRTIDDERLRRPVTVRSSYRRLSDEARWNVDTWDQRDHDGNTSVPAGGSFVPYGTRFVALLDDALSTADARDGDRYTMTARSPSQYEGAIIQGVVSALHGSGRMTGRAGMTLNFQSIRLRDGRSYQFDGMISGVRTPDGETVTVGREGTIDNDDSQTQKSVEHSAIGAALGAIIGAVAGGGKGAAIGAAIGAGGGAGTVLIGGRDQLDLQRGTEITITSGDPRNRPASPGIQR